MAQFPYPWQKDVMGMSLHRKVHEIGEQGPAAIDVKILSGQRISAKHLNDLNVDQSRRMQTLEISNSRVSIDLAAGVPQQEPEPMPRRRRRSTAVALGANGAHGIDRDRNRRTPFQARPHLLDRRSLG